MVKESFPNMTPVTNHMHIFISCLGRKGVTIQAIGAVDLALWDCLGKIWNEPIYNLLGGKTKGKYHSL